MAESAAVLVDEIIPRVPVRQWVLAFYRARIERAVVIDVAGFDRNCPQHITARYSEEELAPVIGPLQARIRELEAQLAGGG